MEGRRRLSLCSNNCRMSYWNSQRKPNGWQDHLYANAEQATPPQLNSYVEIIEVYTLGKQFLSRTMLSFQES